jgi:hypothetical protein
VVISSIDKTTTGLEKGEWGVLGCVRFAVIE